MKHPISRLLFQGILMALTLSATAQTTTIPVINCRTKSDTVHLSFKGSKAEKKWSKEVALPSSGRFVEEAHYVTNQDKFAGGLYPDSLRQGIAAHVERSFLIYKTFDSTATLTNLYGKKPQWTPMEGGKAGQGSVGDIQAKRLLPAEELWLMNMMWAPGKKPAIGTKYLITANGKQVVVIAGYETGPQQAKFLGGVTREVHKWLSANNNSILTIGLLEDQSVSAGPCNCK